MIDGMTVFYRLKHSEADKVNRWRAEGKSFREAAGEENTGLIVHCGDEVKGGMLLPATVIHAYSIAERGTDDPSVDNTEGWARRAFSGIADLKVNLPGNDFLWVPGAKLDRTPQSQTGRGSGITAMPAFGMFVTTPPAQLV